MGVVEGVSAPSEIRKARRALEGFEGLSILHDWRLFERCERWALHLRIKVEVPQGSRLPESTEWYVLVCSDYPLGSVKFFPSKQNCFSETYPHQLYNGPGPTDVPWRLGELCLNTQIRKYDRYEDEPFEAEARLLWHGSRAVEWLGDAATGRLAKDGDPFELPQFPGMPKDLAVAYRENAASLKRWESRTELAGVVELLAPRNPKNVLVVKRYLSLQGQELLNREWGNYIEQESRGESLRHGIWIRTPSVPTLAPWQAPATWGELREACKGVGVNLDSLLGAAVAKIRDGNGHVGLIGFPVPEKRGGPGATMLWQALALPAVASGSVPGFRNSEQSRWLYDRSMRFSNSKEVTWVSSQNWDVAEVSTRGKLGEGIRSKSVLLIGAGSIGSALGELLVRGGVQKLVVLDSDDVQVGNLIRHTLTLEDVGSSKALCLAARLNKISPHAAVVGFKEDFPPSDAATKERVDACDVVIDCTGSDEVVRRLEAYSWKEGKAFFSISLGFDARRIFCVSQKGSFSSREFFREVGPWLELERRENRDRELPREGTGCWNPVFPARADDLWMLLSLVVGIVEDVERLDASAAAGVVFERILSEGRSIGVRKRTTLESDTN